MPFLGWRLGKGLCGAVRCVCVCTADNAEQKKNKKQKTKKVRILSVRENLGDSDGRMRIYTNGKI